MHAFVKSVGIIIALAVLFVSFSDAAFPQGKNLKTSAKQLNPLERFLIRTFKPQIPLDKILAQELSVEGGSTREDNYNGVLEWWNLELPLFLMQLNKMGDQVLFPAWTYENGWWFCYLGYCDGFYQIKTFRHPILKGLKSASLEGSVNGTHIRVHHQISDLEGRDPTYTYDYTDYGQDPPATSDHYIYENASLFIKNYSLIMTANIEMGPNGLEVSNMKLDWTIDEFRFRYENGTHTFPDGRQEEWGPAEEDWKTGLMDYWLGEDDIKTVAEEYIQIWLNCFLSNGRNGGSNCDIYLNESLHRQSFAELIHAFGLNALNKLRAAEE